MQTRAAKTVGTAVACLMIMMLLPAFNPEAHAETRTPYDQFLAWGDDVSFTTTIGANQPITISYGQMHYNDFCFDGVQDYFYPSSDVYIVPTGSVHLQDQLSDVSGGKPNTVNSPSAGGGFIDETIGYTAPDGKIKPGVYDIVYDECQDGKFGFDDALFEKALTVTADPVHAPPIAQLAPMKAAATLASQGIKELSERVKVVMEAAALADLDPVNLLIGSLDKRVPFFADFRKVVVILVLNLAKHYDAIAADPPDPAFRQPDSLRGSDVVDPLSDGAFNVALARLATAESTQGSLAEGFLHAIERYQGAAQAGDGAWALSHARSVRDTARALAAQTEVSSAAVTALRSSMPSAGLATDAQLDGIQAVYDRVRSSGFTLQELAVLREVGLDDPAIGRFRDELGSVNVAGAKTSNLQADLDAFVSTQAALATAARDLATDMAGVVTTLEPQAFPVPPSVDAGGPYAGPENGSITLHGSTSGNGTDLRWDTNGDGVYDDATGATPTVTLGQARDGVVSLLATDASGVAGVAYAQLSVTDADRRPVLDSSSPTGRDVYLVAGGGQTFSVTASDPEARPVSTTWSLDGTNVGDGSTYSYSPAAGDVGRHHLEALTTDGSPLGGSVRRLWNVVVRRAPGPPTPPTIVPTVSPGPGPDGWNTTDVAVGWSVYDPTSDAPTTAGCGPTRLSNETPGTIVTCSATGGSGLSAEQSVTVKIDRTAPATTVTIGRPANRQVAVDLAAADGAGSGVAAIRYILQGAQTGSGVIAGTAGTVTVTAEGTTYVTYAARDRAGNWAPPKVVPVVNELAAADYTVDPNYSLSIFASGFTTVPCCGGTSLGPIGLAFDPSGNLLVGDYADGTLHRFGPSGGVAAPANQVNPTPFTDALAGVAYSKTGSLYIVRQQGNGDVLEIDPGSGTVIRRVLANRPGVTGIAVDPISGDLFVSDVVRPAIVRISNLETGPGDVSEYAHPGVVDGLSFAPDGTLYAAQGDTGVSERVITIAGTNTSTPGAVTRIAASVPSVDGVAVAASADPSAPPSIFANRNDGKITRIDLGTSPPTTTDIVSNGTRGDFLTVGPDGCLYATQSSTVIKVTSVDGSCRLAPIGAAPQLRLSPPLSGHDVGTAHTVTASFANDPVPAGTPVTVTVSGANARTGTATTDANGAATFAYTGAAAGLDDVTATADVRGIHLVSNTTKVVWVPPPPDTIAPSTNAAPGPTPNGSGWNNGAVTVGLTAADNPGGSGVKEIGTSLSGAQTGAAVAPGESTSVTVSSEGLTTLTYGATDNAGNREAPGRLDIRVDRTPPETASSTAPAPPSAGWNAGDVLVRLSATDNPNGSGVSNIHYQLSGAQTGEGTGGELATTTISAEGTTTVTYTATDRAGNTTAAKTLTVNVDRSPPATQVASSPAPNADGWNRSDPTVTLTARDSGVGVKQIDYALAGPDHRGGVLHGGTGAVTVSAEGVTTMRYFATDALGHQEVPRSVVVRLDKKAPRTFAVPSDRADGNGTFRGPVAIDLRAIDLGGSGARELSWSLSGAQSGSGRTDASRARVAVDAPGTTRLTYWAKDRAGNVEAAQHIEVTIGSTRPTALAYSGDIQADFHDPATLAAILTDTSAARPVPVAGQPLTFKIGQQSCTATTDTAGRAACGITPDHDPGTFKVDVTFGGTSTERASSASADFTITKEETSLSYAGPTAVARGAVATLTAALAEDGTTPLDGRAVTLTIGTGTSAQRCTGTTSSAGVATCGISPVAQPLGPAPVSAAFDGDTAHRPASASGTVFVYAPSAGGTFVVGNRSVGSTTGAADTPVTFWGSQWEKANSLSRGPAPAAFKGFAAKAPIPACGGTWISSPGNSPGPPASVPTYTAVVVSSSVTKSGSALTGDTQHIAVVKTDAGYLGDPGHPGTGTIVAFIC